MLPYRQPDRTRLDSFRDRIPQAPEDVMRYLHAFGCLCFKKNPIKYLNFSPRATACLNLGYDWLRKSFALYDIHLNKITHSIEVEFSDSAFPARDNLPLEARAGLMQIDGGIPGL